jgi:Ca2+-binding RTX toxin-like protein
VYSYNVQWGDGGAVQTLSGPSGTQATHVYVGTGANTISMTATDPNGDISMPVSTSVSITTVAMEADPANANLTALYVGGTTGNDTIAITPVVNNGVDNGVNVAMNFVSYGSFTPTGHVVVYSQSGNDIIKTAPVVVSGVTYYVNVPALFFAGNGNDVLNVSGSAATNALGNVLGNALVGGAGADTLLGGLGRDFLIGGSGPSTVRAGSGGNILIGGTTDFDNNAAALAALLAEWDSADDYATRIARITGTMSGGLNGSVFLNPSTVHSDGMVNKLYGGPGMDWYFAGIMDIILNKTAGEVVTMV